jgi:hypothetical protein
MSWHSYAARQAIERVCELIGTFLAQRGFAVEARLDRDMSLTCWNNGGRGRYRTADRWCVKPELYH